MVLEGIVDKKILEVILEMRTHVSNLSQEQSSPDGSLSPYWSDMTYIYNYSIEAMEIFELMPSHYVGINSKERFLFSNIK